MRVPISRKDRRARIRKIRQINADAIGIVHLRVDSSDRTGDFTSSGNESEGWKQIQLLLLESPAI